MSEKTLKDLEKLFNMEQELDIPMKDRFHKTLSDEQVSELSCSKGSYPAEHKSIFKSFRPKYLIGCDLSTHKADYSAATIFKINDGNLEVIDMKSSKDSSEVKKFVETYEPEFFTFKYQLALTTGRIFS